VDITSNPLLFPFEGSDRAAAADQYRVLRTNLVHHPARPSLIAVSSATPGDGKTLTAVNTAGILAWKNEGDVLLIDADLRRRSVAPLLGIPQEPGFADVLQSRCTIDEAIANVPAVPRLHVLTAGTPSVNPAELLDSAACRDILTLVRGRFRYVVVDTAPIGVLTDFDLVQPCCDGVVVVVRPDHTNRKLLNQALSHMPADAVLGVVLNGYQDWLLSVTPASYAYAYERK
jgi:capsular exopolysaccharide synthesis family protein